MNKTKQCRQCATTSQAVPTMKGGHVPFVCDNCGCGVGALDHKGLGRLIAELRTERDLYKHALENISLSNSFPDKAELIDEIVDGVLARVYAIKY